jgi:hypothetical protein
MARKPGAFVDSEQMWRMETQKRRHSNLDNDNDDDDNYSDSTAPEEDLLTFTQSPSKALRTQPQPSTKNAIICRERPLCNRNPTRFKDLASYETHHKQYHELVCLECKLHFPTERILSLHIEERHDPFVEAQRAKKTYKVRLPSSPIFFG